MSSVNPTGRCPKRLVYSTPCDVIRLNELQVWFVAEHVVDMPLVQAV